MDFKGTQGNWIARQDDDHPTLHQIWNVVGFGEVPTYIAKTCFAPMSERNSKLIAASPILLDALIEIAGKLDSEEMNVNSNEFRLWKIANDAIKCAVG